jgi:16S rRNA (guanine527-N7)-methyltransferase
LVAVLETARAAGFLGPGPVEPHIRHADGFVRTAVAVLGGAPDRFCDLGSGGGLPALVLAARWPAAGGVLVESSRRRSAFLREALERLGFTDRIEVLEERAESAAHADRLRERFPLVTARSFAEPAVTAEIAAGLVEVGGALVVSEPPADTTERWPAVGLAELGFGPAVRDAVLDAHFVTIRKVRAAPADVPRGVGRPAKRPRW